MAAKYTKNDMDVKAFESGDRARYEIFLTSFDVDANKETATAASSTSNVMNFMLGRPFNKDSFKDFLNPSRAYMALYFSLFSFVVLFTVILVIVFIIFIIRFIIKKDEVSKLYVKLLFFLLLFLLGIIVVIMIVMRLRDNAQNNVEKIVFKL